LLFHHISLCKFADDTYLPAMNFLVIHRLVTREPSAQTNYAL